MPYEPPSPLPFRPLHHSSSLFPLPKIGIKELVTDYGLRTDWGEIQGWTRFSPIPDLHATTTADWDTCFAVNVKAQNYLLRTALPTFTANPEGGAFIMTSSIAGVATSGSSLPYCVTKAAQLQLMRVFAASQGPKVRCNAVCPGLLLTEWVSGVLVLFVCGVLMPRGGGRGGGGGGEMR